jgi:hypothetical protein
MAISTTGYKKTPSRCGGFLLSAQGDADKRWVVAGACQNTGVEVSRRRSSGRPLDMFNAAIVSPKAFM